MPPPRKPNNDKGFAAFTLLVKALRSNLSFSSLRCRFRGFRFPDFCPSAFTLAEVLITLTILGVVAALGISSLVQTYKRTMATTKLKMIYSTIQNVIERSEVENGPAERWDWVDNNNDSKYFADKYILPYLDYKLLYYHRSSEQQGTYPYTKGNNNTTRYHTIRDLKGSDYDAIGLMNNIVWIRLKNGMDIGIKRGTHGWHDGGLLFWIDINGANKGKNQVGSDIFVISLKIYIWNTHVSQGVGKGNQDTSNHRAFVEPGITDPWITGPNMLTAAQVSGTAKPCNVCTTQALCNKNASSGQYFPSGAWCSYVIYKNNWKIPDNYPVNF